MAIRQYIGARYVTKIYENSLDPSSSEWEASVNYEPLTVVTYNNGSYMSKKDVPASVGNPADNPTYWTQTGFYNGQIAALQAAVNALNNKIYNKKFVIIADSFGQLPGGNTFIDKLVSYYGLTSDEYFTSVEGGSGYSVAGNLGNTFSDLIDNISVTNPETMTHFIIMGGINDTNELNTTGNFDPGIISVINKAKALCPKAQIIACYNCDYVYGFTVTRRSLKNTYRSVFIKTINGLGVTSLDVSTLSQIGGFIDFSNNDYIHPTATGAQLLAVCVANCISGGGENPQIYDVYSDASLNAGYRFRSDGHLSRFQFISGTTFDFSGSPINLSATAVSVGNITTSPIPLNDIPIRIPFARVIDDGGTTYTSNLIVVITQNGDVKFLSPVETYTNVTSILIATYVAESIVDSYTDI